MVNTRSVRAHFVVNNPTCQVIYEDSHLLVVNKPAGLAVMSGTATPASVHRWAANYLKQRYHKPGNVYIGIVHRLDKPVTGVLVLARTSKAASRLTEQFRSKSVEKIYWAIVEGIFPGVRGTLQDWLCRDERAQRVRVSRQRLPGSHLAVLHYERKSIGRGLSWLELRPETGRRHQLRAQLADRGCPIYGDRKYGSSFRLDDAIALHAYKLSIVHPITGAKMTFTAKPPAFWQPFAFLGVPIAAS
jgi:23S rRNA pseudouridine1911/1915/1917 synthase